MSTTEEKISKLEALLSKVTTRASLPRPPNNGPAAYAAAPITAEPIAHLDSAPPPTPVPVTMSDPPGAYEASDEVLDVEVSAEVVEVDIDVEEAVPEFAKSGSQPVAEAHALSDDDLELEPQAHVPAANEIEEPAPSSSPRPITDAQYAEESAPRHTPPPESGKQVAATPVPPRKSSSPPPSLEGHTLIGGWREPGLSPNAGGKGSHGVRVPAPPPQAAEEQRAAPPIAPDVTKPELPLGAARVAAFQGAPPSAKPATFGEFLDDTLGI